MKRIRKKHTHTYTQQVLKMFIHIFLKEIDHVEFPAITAAFICCTISCNVVVVIIIVIFMVVFNM